MDVPVGPGNEAMKDTPRRKAVDMSDNANSVASAAPQTLSRSDRLELLSRFTPDLQKTLRIALRYRGNDGFDQTLLSYMRKRDGVTYF